MKNALNIGQILLLGAGLFVGCGGLDVDPSNPGASALVVADSVSALGVAAEVASPLAARPTAGDTMSGVRDVYERKITCAEVSLASGMVSVDFGSGCQLHGHTVSGAFTVTHTRTSSASTFGVLLDGLSSQGQAVDGRVNVSGSGAVITANATLMVTASSMMSEHLFTGTFSPDAAGVLIEGSSSRDDGATARNLTYDAVYLSYGDCYPTAGTITVEGSGQPATTVTFSAATASSGEVSVRVGRLPAQTVVLPACPRA